MATREQQREWERQYRERHRDKVNARQRLNRKSESFKEWERAYRKRNRPKRREYFAEYARRWREIPANYVAHRLRINLRAYVKRKSASTVELVGCSWQALVDHLSSKFTIGMTVQGLVDGAIEIDHIKPCASFDLTQPEQQRICFHYTNLQPLWMADNRRKGKKITP